MLRGLVASFVGVAGLLSGIAFGSVMEVGSGGNTAGVVINFKDGAAVEFAVKFEGTVSGMGLLGILEANTGLTVQKLDFGFGVLVDGFSYEGHANSGYWGGDDWWHYWTKDSVEGTWKASMIGASDRLVTGGEWDGWVYGRGGAPVVPEPAGVVVLAAGWVLMRRRGSI